MKRSCKRNREWRCPTHLCIAACLLLGLVPAQASDFPSRPVKLVVGYAAGGSVDLVARTVAAPLARRLGQPVTVENVAGASGTIAAVQVALAPPDGYTLLLGSPSELGMNHQLRRSSRPDPSRHMTAVGLVGSQPMVLVANRHVKAQTVDQFLAWVQAHPLQARYGSAGPGTPLHLAGETIKLRAGVNLVHVPYRGAGPILPDLMEGRLEFAVMVLSSALAPLREGRLQAVGLTSAARAPAAPTIPALAEHPRLRGLDLGVWFVVMGPAKLPPAVTERLQRELRAVLKEPAVRQPLQAAGVALMEDTPAEPFLQAELHKFKRVIDEARLTD